MSAIVEQAVATPTGEYFEPVRHLVDDDMRAVDACIRRSLHSEVALINQVSDYIIGGGGKRLRPMMHLLSARALGHRGEAPVTVAAIIEFIHTATLLHDDVVDESELRRGKNTANATWGNAASVLVGDFLYSRAFQMMVDVDSMRVMQILAETTNTIAEGEVMQLLNQGNPDTDEAGYLNVIRCKTAKLFEAAAQLGAVLAGSSAAVEMAMARYGLHLGIAFQLADDMLDYDGDSAVLGKNVGDDLAEGKPTLPLIHVLRVGNPDQRQVVRRAIESDGLDHLDQVVAAIQDTRAMDYTRTRAETEARMATEALSALPDSEIRQGLLALANLAVSRRA